MRETYLTVAGNVITDPKLRTTADGLRVVNFRMASTERKLDRQEGQWVDGETLYLNVSCWRRVADGVISSLSKGDPVLVTGRVFTRGYEIDGQQRTAVELVANAVGPDLARCTAEVRRHPRAPLSGAEFPDRPAGTSEVVGGGTAAANDTAGDAAEGEVTAA